MPWSLSSEASTADRARGRGRYDGGGPWDPANCAPAQTPEAQQLGRTIREYFPWVRTIGGLRCEPLHAASGDQLSIHASGRALDVMVPTHSGPEGASLANWLVTNAAELRLQLVIWNGSVWQGSLAQPRLRPYSGSNPHVDHVHVEVLLPGGSPMPSESPTMTRREQWVNRWFDELVKALDRRGLDPEHAFPIAKWITVHYWRETGAGAHEYAFNGGNMHCGGTPDPAGGPGWHGACTTTAGGESLRAYATARDAAEDYLQLLEGVRGADGIWRGRYRDAWNYLLDHPDDGLEWYRRLLADGYSGLTAAALHDFNSIAHAWFDLRGR